MSEQGGELYSLTTFDGKRLVFSGKVRFKTKGFFGAPPTSFQTRRGYRQHGVTEVDYQLEPRRLSFTLWRDSECSRQDYWNMRKSLHDFLRPNRNGPITLTILFPDGEERSIVARADPGLQFPPSEEENAWNVNEGLEFICFDPIWFDPVASVATFAQSTGGELRFPAEFPISFGLAGLDFTTQALTYLGTWQTYPIFTLIGPYTRVTLLHVEFGIEINLAVAIPAGQTRILDLTPGSQSLVDQDGNSKFGDLGSGSNLVDFRIAPDPEMPGGQQTILISVIEGVSGQSAVTMRYNDRYFAL